MKTEFINGWDRTHLGGAKYEWSCRYCKVTIVTNYEDLYHGCQLREFGLGDLIAVCLSKMKITKRLVTSLLRKVSTDKKVKCACGERLRMVNAVGRFFGVNYILTTLYHGKSPKRFARERACPPENSSPTPCPTGPPITCHARPPHRPPQGRH